MVSPFVPHRCMAAVGHGGPAMRVPVGSDAPVTAVLQPPAVAFSGLSARTGRLLKGKYLRSSWRKAFDRDLLVGTLDVEQSDFSRKSHFGKIVEPAR
jgi:hypothetical protein